MCIVSQMQGGILNREGRSIRGGVDAEVDEVAPGVEADGHERGVLLGLKILDALHERRPTEAAVQVCAIDQPKIQGKV